MASGDTKTQQLLDILEHGGSVEGISGSGNTKTQDYIVQNIESVKAAETAIQGKGGTASDAGLAGLQEAIESIPAGGGGGFVEPVVPPSPEGVYAVVKAQRVIFNIGYSENADPSITTVTFTYPTNFPVWEWTPPQPDFALDSIFFWSPAGGVCNLILAWNAGAWKFELAFVDSQDNRQVYRQLDVYELEQYGIVLSNPDFMFNYQQDCDLAYVLVEQSAAANDIVDYTIEDAGEFAQFMTIVDDYWYTVNEGNGFPCLMRVTQYGTSDLLQKQFVTDINFGTLAASSLTTIGNNFGFNTLGLRTIYNLPDSITSIGSGFLQECSLFNSYFRIPSHATIGDGFLSSCRSFNQPLIIPAGVTLSTSSNYGFMFGCENMLSEIKVELPATSISNSKYILSTFSSSDPCYAQGIRLTGQYAQDWKDLLTDRTSAPYRKLIVES